MNLNLVTNGWTACTFNQELSLTEVTRRTLQARGSQQRYAERHREASTALNAAEERAEASQELVKHLKGLVEDKESRVSDLERQLRSASSVCYTSLASPRSSNIRNMLIYHHPASLN